MTPPLSNSCLHKLSTVLLTIICVLLVPPVTTIVCEKEVDLNGNSAELFLVYREIFEQNTEYPGYLNNIGEHGRLFYDMNDKNNLVRMFDAKPDNKDIVEEYRIIDNAVKFSDMETTGREGRLAPRVSVHMCVILTDGGNYFTIMIRERSKGGLQNTINGHDPQFPITMRDFPTRMMFYKNMFQTIGILFDKGYKFCNFKPSNFVFAIRDFDFNNPSDMPNPPEYFVMLSPFDFAVPVKKSCVSPNQEYSDQIEFLGKIANSDQLRRKTDYLSVALIIYYVESGLWTSWVDDYSRADNLNDDLTAMGLTASRNMKGLSYEDNPITEMKVHEVFEYVPFLNKRWNTIQELEKQVTYDSIVYDMAHVSNLMYIFYIYDLVERFPKLIGDGGKAMRAEFKKAFAFFTGVILSMCAENKSKNGRPDAATVESAFDSAAQHYTNIYLQAQALGRLLLV